MSSRQSLGAPVLYPQRGRDRTRRKRACQNTRRIRQLGENDSRRAVGAVSGIRIDAGHHGGKHRGRVCIGRNRQHHAQDRRCRAARSAGAARVRADIASLDGRPCFCRGRRIFIRLGCPVVVHVRRGVVFVLINALDRFNGWRLCGCSGTSVIGTTHRHRHARHSLCRNGKHQQPDQQSSYEKIHRQNVPQRASLCWERLFRSPRCEKRHRSQECQRSNLTVRRRVFAAVRQRHSL